MSNIHCSHYTSLISDVFIHHVQVNLFGCSCSRKYSAQKRLKRHWLHMNIHNNPDVHLSVNICQICPNHQNVASLLQLGFLGGVQMLDFLTSRVLLFVFKAVHAPPNLADLLHPYSAPGLQTEAQRGSNPLH